MTASRDILISVVANIDGEDVFIGEYTTVEAMEEEIYKLDRAIQRELSDE